MKTIRQMKLAHFAVTFLVMGTLNSLAQVTRPAQNELDARRVNIDDSTPVNDVQAKENLMIGTSITQFWWNWWVSFAVAAGTIGAVIVALFGQAFRAKYFPAKLTLDIVSADGELTALQSQNGTSIQTRFYHIRVTNSRRWSPGTGVSVVLLQVEEPGPDGRLQIRWTGDVPFGWRHRQLFPVSRTIGAQADIDLCSVTQSGHLQLHLLLIPFNLEAVRSKASTMVLSVQARGDQTDSTVLRVQIAWDGKWEQGAAEMRHHLDVKKIT